MIHFSGCADHAHPEVKIPGLVVFAQSQPLVTCSNQHYRPSPPPLYLSPCPASPCHTKVCTAPPVHVITRHTLPSGFMDTSTLAI